MGITIQASVVVPAPRSEVWRELIDWEGQGRWIPSTTVTVTSAHRTGLGVRVAAFSGVHLGPVPLGLLDRFVTTGWTDGHEVEVLHLGPFFTGVGVFGLSEEANGTRFTVVEDAELPVPGLARLARPLAPLLDAGLALSLRRFAQLFPAPP